MQDTIKATSFGFVEIHYRRGGSKLVALSDVLSAQSRKEGGSSLRLANGHIILLDVPVRSVAKALQLANEGVDHASA
jgi:hypothetical protein